MAAVSDSSRRHAAPDVVAGRSRDATRPPGRFILPLSRLGRYCSGQQHHDGGGTDSRDNPQPLLTAGPSRRNSAPGAHARRNWDAPRHGAPESPALRCRRSLATDREPHAYVGRDADRYGRSDDHTWTVDATKEVLNAATEVRGRRSLASLGVVWLRMSRQK